MHANKGAANKPGDKMKVLKGRNKEELMAKLKELNGEDTVYINMRPTIDIVNAVINASGSVRSIVCPPSLHAQASLKVRSALEGAGIELRQGDFRVGRPKKYDQETVQAILGRKGSGQPAKAIAQEMDIPLRTVYFYLKNGSQ